jgi:hypothetical protein
MSSPAVAEDFFRSIHIQLYFHVACTTVWAYDHYLTFASEASHIWNSPWTFPKILYIISKYWSTVTLTILLRYHFSRDTSPKDYLISERFVIWSTNFGMCLAEIILTIRTWAVWGRSRKVAIFLCIFFAAIWIPGFIVMGVWEGAVEYVAVPREIVRSGYWPEVRSSLYFVNYILIAIFEGVLLIMMSIKAYTALKHGFPDFRFFRAVYVDGMLVYLVSIYSRPTVFRHNILLILVRIMCN